MPISIGEVTSDVSVDAPAASPAPPPERPLPEVAERWRWQELRRRHEQDAERVAASDHDD